MTFETYNLNYTANEINEKLEKIDSIEKDFLTHDKSIDAHANLSRILIESVGIRAGVSNLENQKLYLIGSHSQNDSSQETCSNKNVYIGTDNCLYSNNTKVATESYVDKKVTLPINGNEPVYGTVGQFAVSDGNGGITWVSLTNVAEVGA